MIGRLLNPKGIVAETVELTLTPDNRRVGLASGWRGEVWLPIDSHVVPGDTLTLELVGGTASSILVDRVTVDTEARQMLVRFTGSGSLGPPPYCNSRDSSPDS
jgi:hypothetical protein